MSLQDIASRLADRAAHAGLALPDSLATRLVVYYQLLDHWNQKINLTSLSDADEAVDRLLLEPVSASTRLPQRATLVDLGSGGGSPAIPLALATEATQLVMVESRSRKAAFLREAVRELGLPAVVEGDRFEVVAQLERYHRHFDALSIRAVRLEGATFETIASLLKPNGMGALFRTVDAEDPPKGLVPTLRWLGSSSLLPLSRSVVTLLEAE